MPCMEGWDVFLWNMHAAMNRGNRAWHNVSVASVEQPGSENMTSGCRMHFCPFRGLICFLSQCLWCWHPLDKVLEELLLWRENGWCCQQAGYCSPHGEPRHCRSEGFLWAKFSNKEIFEDKICSFSLVVLYLLSGEWPVLPAQVRGYPDNSWSWY